MASLSISFPAKIQHYVDTRAAAAGLTDPADFLRDLVRRDRVAYAADVEGVRVLIQEGIDSGIVDAEPEDLLDEIVADIRDKHG